MLQLQQPCSIRGQQTMPMGQIYPIAYFYMAYEVRDDFYNFKWGGGNNQKKSIS